MARDERGRIQIAERPQDTPCVGYYHAIDLRALSKGDSKGTFVAGVIVQLGEEIEFNKLDPKEASDKGFLSRAIFGSCDFRPSTA